MRIKSKLISEIVIIPIRKTTINHLMKTKINTKGSREYLKHHNSTINLINWKYQQYCSQEKSHQPNRNNIDTLIDQTMENKSTSLQKKNLQHQDFEKKFTKNILVNQKQTIIKKQRQSIKVNFTISKKSRQHLFTETAEINDCFKENVQNFLNVQNETTNVKKDISKNMKIELKPIKKSKLAVNKTQVLNRNTVEKNSLGLKVNNFSESDERYYISQAKRSIFELLSERQFMNAHLTHLIQSMTTFQTARHSSIPSKPLKSYEVGPKFDSEKITLIFDMDQTLLHCDPSTGELDWGQQIEIPYGEASYKINAKIRPFALEVLQRLKDTFQLGLFTASLENYATKVLKLIDPQEKIFSFRLYRQHCHEMQSKQGHIKDLRSIKDRDLSKIFLIDNSPHTYLFQKCNAIPITSFLCDRDDQELLKLEKFVTEMSGKKNPQQFVKDYFKLERYSHFNNLLDLMNSLYA